MSLRRFGLVSLVAAVAAYTPSPHCMRTQSTRSQPAHVVMKGKGSRGIPGKATSGRTASGGITDKAKKKFEIDDFNAKSEWTLVSEKAELGAETGSKKAVAAGVARKHVESGVSAPQGQEYVWSLIRGLPMEEGKDKNPEDSTCYVTDGSCRTCLFPLTQSNVEAVVDADGNPSHTMTCGLCATKWDLNSGKVLEFLPGNGPAQFAAKLANSKKEETPCTVLKTRISKEGTINEREDLGKDAPKGFGKKK